MNIASGLPIQINKDLLGSKASSPRDSKVDSSQSESQAGQQLRQKSGSFAEKLSEKSKSAEKPINKPKDNFSSEPVAPVEVDSESPIERVQHSDTIASRVAVKGEGEQPSPLKVLTKAEAMQAFLDRMEGELGIEPEQVVQAFAKLDVDMLMAAPEQSAQEFLDNLNLNPADHNRAMTLYSELLTWRSTADLSEKLKTQGQSAEVAVLSKDEMVKRERMEGLSNLSDRFFMMGDYGRGAKLANNMKAMRAYGPATPDAMAMNSEPQVMKAQNLSPAFASGGLDVSSMDAAVNPADLQGLNIPEKTTAEMANAFKAMMKPVGSSALEVESLDVPTMEGLETPGSAFELPAVNGLQKFQSESSSEDSLLGANSNNEQDIEGSEDVQDTFAAQLDNKTQKIEGAKNFNVGAPVPTDLDMSENIREMIRGAQVMVKDGGGEMKINLNPEGMGEVNLKVLVQNGEVKVEMITSSDETKKLLEKGLSELKESLSAHKLNVEHLKIESAQKPSDHMMNDRQQAAERGFQQRFLQEFRDQNTGRRGQTMGVSSARGLSSQTADAAGNDLEASRRKRLDRRLDLVA